MPSAPKATRGCQIRERRRKRRCEGRWERAKPLREGKSALNENALSILGETTKLREVVDIYPIPGRAGTMIIVAGTTDLPVSVKLAATFYRPDGTSINIKVYKDWIVYPTQSGSEPEGFFLFDQEILDIPTRSLVEIVVDSAPGQNE